MVDIYYLQMTANRMLAENISALLRARHQTQKDLCTWCHHSEVWLSKFLRGEREIQTKDFDRIADFFGIATYQLFQPGISSVTERRVGSDRRAARDRRIGHSQRLLGELAETIDAARPGAPQGRPHDQETPLGSLVRDFERRLATLYAQTDPGRQTARARPAVAARRPRPRPPRRPTAAKS